MKTIYSLYTLSVATIAAFTVLFAACSDDDNKEAVPVISNVRLTDPSTAGLSLSKAPLGATLAIEGNNLGSVVKLFLNDQEVPLSPTYVTNANILVTITDKVPTVATNPNVPNTMRLLTRGGQTISYAFETLPPPALIESVSNEMAKAGETITLGGKYFFFVNAVIFPGDVAGTNITAAPDGTWAKVTVPPGVAAGGGHIRVVSNSGISNITRRSHFNDRTGIITDFDAVNNFGWGIDPNSNITSMAPGGIIAPIDGKFGLINMVVASWWSWSNDKVIDLQASNLYPSLATGGAKYDTKNTMTDFDLRLEAAVEATTTIEGLVLTVYAKVEADEFSFNAPLKESIKSLDGKWYTISVPLAKLATSGKTTMATYGDLLKQEPHDLRLVINNSAGIDIKSTIAIDNIRIINATR